MASAPTLSRPAREELIRQLLSPREQSLLRMSANGKSPEAIAAIYREYEGPNGVRDALARIAEKLQRAAEGRANGNGDGAELSVKIGQVAGLDERQAMELGGKAAEQEEREASARDANMPEPALPAEPARLSETPPNGAAPAPDRTLGLPAGSSSSPESSPARRRGRTASYRAEILQCIREHGPISKQQIADRVGCSAGALNRSLASLRTERVIHEAGMVERHGHGGGAKLWAFGPPPAGQCAHGHAARCVRPALPGVEPAPEAPAFPPTFAAGSFDARELWQSLSPERQKLLARVVLAEVVYPAISDLLLS